MKRRLRAVPVVLVASGVFLAAQGIVPRVSYVPFSDAEPILKALSEILPQELKDPPDKLQSEWPAWVVQRDSEIRARLAQGEEDTIVNFLLFGTSFTRQPRVSAGRWQELRNQEQAGSRNSHGLSEIFATRLHDLVLAATSPGRSERLRFVRGVFTRKGYDLGSVAGRRRAEEYLKSSLSRVLNESASYAEILRSARSLGDPSEEFIRRSTLFHDRGLSLDTSWKVNFALEDSLVEMKARGLLAPNSVHRVGIIGPGLDFTDKQEGFDFYPQQTIQPFAVFDTLLRLGLAREDTLTITTLDISRRVSEHLKQARARFGKGYVVQLPLDAGVNWTRDTLDYWQRLGDHVGTRAVPAPAPKSLAGVKVRAVRVRPAIVERTTPADINIILQRLDLAPEQRFDLLVATNIFVYYDTFEQSLALTNVGAMLKPGGFLLSNNVLLELPSSPVRSAGHKTTAYSDRATDGDHIVWYQYPRENHE
jgi:hypothetical protein